MTTDEGAGCAGAGRFARVITVSAGLPLVCRTVQGKIINTARVTWPPLVGSIAGSVAHALFLWAFYSARAPAAFLSAHHQQSGASL